MPSENDTSLSKSKKRKVDDDTDFIVKKKKRSSNTGKKDWTTNDVMKLVENIEKQIPTVDPLHYKSRNGRLNFTKAAVDGYSAAECQQKWTSVCQQARHYTKLTYLIPVIKDMIQNKCPELPKQPKNPYLSFYCEKFQAVKEENPDLTMKELTRIISKLYADLKEKKKMKYIETYKKEKAAYDQEIRRLMLENPDLDFGKKKHSKQRRETPQSLYVDHCVQKATEKDSTINVKEASEEFRKKWTTLKDKKKLKWIQMAAEAEKKAEENEEKTKDVKKEEKKSVLTKAEQRIKDRADGRPDKPPISGYQLFTTEVMSKLTHIASKDRFKESAFRWKSLSDQERATYNEKAKKALEKYSLDVKTYIDSLPEKERAKASDSFKQKRSTKPKSSKESEMLLKAEIFFIDDQKELYKNQHPDLDDYQIVIELMKKFNTLSKSEKEKYLPQSSKEQDQKKITDFFNTSDSADGNSSSFVSEDEEVFTAGQDKSHTHTKIKEKKLQKKKIKKEIQKSASETITKSPNKSPVKKMMDTSSSESSSDSEDERPEVKSASKNAKKDVNRKSPVKQVQKKHSSSSSSSDNDDDDDDDEKKTLTQTQTKVLSPKKSPVKQLKKQNNKESSSSSSESSSSSDSSSSSSDSEEETKSSGSKVKQTPAKQLPKQNVKTESIVSSDSSSESDDSD